MNVRVFKEDEIKLHNPDKVPPDFLIYNGKMYRKQGLICDFLIKLCYSIIKRKNKGRIDEN